MAALSVQPRSKSQGTRPPQYPTEGHLPDRTLENDKKALKMAILAFEAIHKPNRNSSGRQAGASPLHVLDMSKGEEDSMLIMDNKKEMKIKEKISDEHSHTKPYDEDVDDGKIPKIENIGEYVAEGKNSDEDEDKDGYIRYAGDMSGTIFGPKPDVMIPLRSMFAGSGPWPKRKDPSNALQQSWSNIGFPDDISLVVNNFEDDTHIERHDPAILELSLDIANIKAKAAIDIADGGVKRHVEDGRIIETFEVHGRAVSKIKFEDCNVLGEGYDKCRTSKRVEKKIDTDMGTPPALEIEQ
jgi:hypothetical protein